MLKIVGPHRKVRADCLSAGANAAHVSRREPRRATATAPQYEFEAAGTRHQPKRRGVPYLNAPRVHIELLATNGFIKPHVPARAFAAADKYAVADLDDFVGRLFERAHPVRKPKHNQVSIAAAAKRACCSAEEILTLILGRKLSWVGKLTSERGYLAVLVDLDEIIRNVQLREFAAGIFFRYVSQSRKDSGFQMGYVVKIVPQQIGKTRIYNCGVKDVADLKQGATIKHFLECDLNRMLYVDLMRKPRFNVA